jgi:hypothetical protein
VNLRDATLRTPLAVDNLGKISGNHYVVVQITRPEPGTFEKPGRVPVRSAENCDHGVSICTLPKCINGWQWDYDILFGRTAAGRKLLELHGPDIDKNQNKAHEAWKIANDDQGA